MERPRTARDTGAVSPVSHPGALGGPVNASAPEGYSMDEVEAILADMEHDIRAAIRRARRRLAALERSPSEPLEPPAAPIAARDR